VDGDCDLDLVAANHGQVNRLYLNNGMSDPWNGVDGIDITSDANSTNTVALGDVDNDGDLDLVMGQGPGRNRLYRKHPFHETGRSRATSLEVDTESSPIASITLIDVAALPPNTEVDYWLSNNGGARWYLARPYGLVEFTTLGSDLRWRAELRSMSPASTPYIDQITLSTYFPDPDGDKIHSAIDNCPNEYNPDQLDGDEDGAGDACDCASGDPGIHPGADEINNAIDENCNDLIDEITGITGFHDPADKTVYSWPAQSGATLYQVARSRHPDFLTDCMTKTRTETYWSDSTPLAPGEYFYYMVRSVAPYTGSWGQDSAEVERTDVCP
jgi:hypothetical protein